MDLQKLLKLAIITAKKSYSPYSKFRVGAALLTEDDEIYCGCNIENSSYSVTVCAERVAIYKAISEGKLKFKAIAVAGYNEEDPASINNPCTPCGACLQVLSEFCDEKFLIIMSDGIHKLSYFLPRPFKLEDDTD